MKYHTVFFLYNSRKIPSKNRIYNVKLGMILLAVFNEMTSMLSPISTNFQKPSCTRQLKDRTDNINPEKAYPSTCIYRPKKSQFFGPMLGISNREIYS